MKKPEQSVLLQIAQLGDPVIRRKATEITNFQAPEIQQLIDDMIATVVDVDGVGIAAPQVYKSLRVFIIASHPNPRYPNAPKMKPTAVINPVILSTSKEIKKDWEGCLSIPGIRGVVPRYFSIQVEYFTRDGNKVKRNFKDFVARIFQHEFDHIEGVVFLDRVETSKELVTEKEYLKMMKKTTPIKKLRS